MTGGKPGEPFGGKYAGPTCALVMPRFRPRCGEFATRPARSMILLPKRVVNCYESLYSRVIAPLEALCIGCGKRWLPRVDILWIGLSVIRCLSSRQP